MTKRKRKRKKENELGKERDSRAYACGCPTQLTIAKAI